MQKPSLATGSIIITSLNFWGNYLAWTKDTNSQILAQNLQQINKSLSLSVYYKINAVIFWMKKFELVLESLSKL